MKCANDIQNVNKKIEPQVRHGYSDTDKRVGHLEPGPAKNSNAVLRFTFLLSSAIEKVF